MKIYILYTGGTIGCVGEPLAPMPGPEFKEAFDELVTPTIISQYPSATVFVDYFPKCLDSTNMTPVQWVQIATRIAANYRRFNCFLVLHGTDTMAWTASALSFLLPGLTKSVTVTGSQLPIFVKTKSAGRRLTFRFNTDALRNIFGAVAFFTMDVPEVCLYFCDKLFRGNRTVKCNASDFVAFSSPNYHVLGSYGVLPTLYSQYVRQVSVGSSLAIPSNLCALRSELALMEENINNQSVIQLQTFPGFANKSGDACLFQSMLTKISSVSPRLGGVIFESYGIGNIQSFPALQKQMKEMSECGIVLVDCTQVYAGGVDYNEYATGAWLKEAGLLSGHDMSSTCALAKLLILFARHGKADLATIKTKMGTNLVGELEPYYHISSYRNDFIAPGESLFSVNGDYELANEAEGRVALYDVKDVATPMLLFAIEGTNRTPGRLIMQGDSSLQYVDTAGTVMWEKRTQHSSLSALKVGDDGSLAIYDLETDAGILTVYSGPARMASMTIEDHIPRQGGKKGKRKPRR